MSNFAKIRDSGANNQTFSSIFLYSIAVHNIFMRSKLPNLKVSLHSMITYFSKKCAKSIASQALSCTYSDFCAERSIYNIDFIGAPYNNKQQTVAPFTIIFKLF